MVVGAGIVGLAVAREWKLRHPYDSVAVLERESAPAQHQTGRNSGVIHGGIYYQPGSLKARLCVEGARLMYEYCEHNAIPHERCGKLIVALSTDELPRLDELEARGIANAVPGLRRIGGAEITDVEPNAVGPYTPPIPASSTMPPWPVAWPVSCPTMEWMYVSVLR